ncbi:methyltransferase PMT16 [Pyrus ussuriensis x Pyrus communis]|uniref:Methyltransferase n=1 Tax=Pyrus ussuriensis x Pyrus communis TaxID=2448454 RepID=A0A5N5F648_9ROSA|nr:methyltransferase PMT16 [Pyrus ussuriensis x Pyrus communis]
MASNGDRLPYHPTSKPSKPSLFPWIKRNVYTLPVILFLCICFYFFGLWQHDDTTAVTKTVTSPTFNLPYFNSHHSPNFTATTSSHSAATNEYPCCNAKYSEYTPCEDSKRSLKFDRDRLIYRVRHCPEKSEFLKCRIPAPYGYKNVFSWPRSRDLAWYPHKELTVEKAAQNWIIYGDTFKFLGGGTMFPHGADAYIDDIGKLINLKDGSIRTAIDTGLPALIEVLASKGLPYLSRAFDMAHCSRCLIPWGQHGTYRVYLTEVDRVLRPGKYWSLWGPPLLWAKYWKGWERTKEDLNEEQTSIEDVAKSLCWKKLVKKDDIAIWQKPTNHLSCQNNRKLGKASNFCPTNDPDTAWYTKLETRLTPLPEVSDNEEVAGGKLANRPHRLNAIPLRISKGTVEGVTADVFKQDSELWKKRVSYYKSPGGFAAALVDLPVWVMNVVPVEVKVNTLGIIYERGLIGTYQNWCEAMSTYPRTYDFIHADSVFSLYQDRCNADDILLDMDRILRPEGSVIIRDDVDVLVKIKSIINGMEWDSQIVDHEDGPHEREKLLFTVKKYWTAPAAAEDESSS